MFVKIANLITLPQKSWKGGYFFFTNSCSIFTFLSFRVEALTTGRMLENMTAHYHLPPAGTQTQQLED